MKNLQNVLMAISLVALFASCQSSTDVNKILSNQETKKAIFDKIANDSNLSTEMMEIMMNSENSKMMMKGNEKLTMMMMEDHGAMMKMMNDPGMMKSMMTGMMEKCKNDTAMMSSMCKTMMENPGMMDMMHKKMGGKMDMKGMNGVNKMGGLDNKTK